ncbi:Kelch motif family protein [Tritrichomonas foetus]|uniref:Kelch motif family protein n=1 Tax=Tritrichomonas foetus TaxID=1144522 RepID=A0A1J4JW34_9EUKA|nr:Kelch motif family protein [Tritrichomonas foetus]|eukprot:OHT03219.1 Kelch motif family protein [Tritrichomonas foetus]
MGAEASGSSEKLNFDRNRSRRYSEITTDTKESNFRFEYLEEDKNESKKVQKMHENPPFAGIWSHIYLNGTISDFPVARTRHFFTEIIFEKIKIVFIGFGVNRKGEYLDDIWALNISNKKWSKLNMNGDVIISKRIGASGVVVNDFIVVFGGFDGQKTLNDMYVINWRNGNIRCVNSQRENYPPPMCNAAMAFHNNNLYIWGGDELYSFDIATKICKKKKIATYRPIESDKFVAFSKVYNNDSSVFTYGGDMKSIARLDLDKEEIYEIPQRGSSPPFDVFNAAMVNLNDEYLIFYGGDGNNPYTILYGYNIRRNWWFIFFVRPDGETVSENDGKWNQLNLFMTPRKTSFAMSYDLQNRQIVGFLGEPYESGRSLFVISMGDALSFLHLRVDMLEMVDFQW